MVLHAGGGPSPAFSAQAACSYGPTWWAALPARTEGRPPPHLFCGLWTTLLMTRACLFLLVCVGSGQAVDVLRVRQEICHRVHAAEACAAYPRQGRGAELPAVWDQGVHQGLHEQTHAAQAPGGKPGVGAASSPGPQAGASIYCSGPRRWLRIHLPLQTWDSLRQDPGPAFAQPRTAAPAARRHQTGLQHSSANNTN